LYVCCDANINKGLGIKKYLTDLAGKVVRLIKTISSSNSLGVKQEDLFPMMESFLTALY